MLSRTNMNGFRPIESKNTTNKKRKDEKTRRMISPYDSNEIYGFNFRLLLLVREKETHSCLNRCMARERRSRREMKTN